MKIKILFNLLLVSIFSFAQTGWQQISNFGTNPGSLNMYLYVPVGISDNAPVVVAMHGCTQNAVQFRDNTGWNNLADIYKFYVVYPEQLITNNTYSCFNWFLPEDQNRDGGEALSIKQMVDYVQTHYTVNSGKIFVTGLSAGAGMTSVLLACYPDIFRAGSIMSGTAYKAATDATTATYAMYGMVNKTPVEWRDLVIGAFPGYNGVYPRVAIFHGLNDNVVYPSNINESVEQWTAVHDISQTATYVNTTFMGNADIEQTVYQKPSGDTLVLTYKIKNMFHAIAVDPGIGTMQGGTTGTYSVDKNFYSTYWAAIFFRILDFTTTINQFSSENKTCIYPNPAHNFVLIQDNNNDFKSIKIYDLAGNPIYVSGKRNFDISVFPSGTYIGEIIYKNSNTIRKLIVKE